LSITLPSTIFLRVLWKINSFVLSWSFNEAVCVEAIYSFNGRMMNECGAVKQLVEWELPKGGEVLRKNLPQCYFVHGS
jgi:hypothetical protein